MKYLYLKFCFHFQLSNMEATVKEALNCSEMTRFGQGGGGCISSGQGFHTDIGKIFVKSNAKDGVSPNFTIFTMR